MRRAGVTNVRRERCRSVSIQRDGRIYCPQDTAKVGQEGGSSVTPALQAAVAANSIIAACYFVISALIFIGLVRQRHLGFNSLATATCLIFFTCGLGHATHV